jgi:hypothetical protein
MKKIKIMPVPEGLEKISGFSVEEVLKNLKLGKSLRGYSDINRCEGYIRFHVIAIGLDKISNVCKRIIDNELFDGYSVPSNFGSGAAFIIETFYKPKNLSYFNSLEGKFILKNGLVAEGTMIRALDFNGR